MTRGEGVERSFWDRFLFFSQPLAGMGKNCYLCSLNTMKIIRSILFIINVVLALGLVLTTLSWVVEPSKFIYPSLLAFGYLPMVALNVVMVVLWLLMGRWEALLSVAAIAARWTFLPLFFQFGGTTKVPPAEEHPYMMTVMTYNVHQFQGDGKSTPPRDSVAREFVKLVRGQSPDVLCLQEYSAVRGVNITDSLAVMGYNHYYGAHTASNGSPYGTTVFSRLPITFVKRIDHQKVLVELMLEGQRVRLLCLHMYSYGLDSVDFDAARRMSHGEVQESDRRTLTKVGSTIKEHEREWNELIEPVLNGNATPTIVAGDMNDIPSSWFYHQITRTMTDTYTEEGSGMGATWNVGRMMVRIDMVMRSEGLRTLSYRRIKTSLSDHRPVFVALELDN